MHGMTKMQTYIMLFGSGINCYGGPGEAAHKTFVKCAGQKTQRRVSEFAKQTAYQYYCMLASTKASTKINESSTDEGVFGCNRIATCTLNNAVGEDVKWEFSGQYKFAVTEESMDEMLQHEMIAVTWLTKNSVKSRNINWKLNKLLVKCLYRFIRQQQQQNNLTKIIGYTRAIIINLETNERTIFYSHPCYQGESWYDWAMIQFKEYVHGEFVNHQYPSRILGFISINGQDKAVVQCSKKHLTWEDLLMKFIVTIELGMEFNVSFMVVPIDAIVHPLCVIPDDGEDQGKYFIILPKCNWSGYFGNKIGT